MIVPYAHVLLLAGVLFVLGMFCAVTRRNLIMMVIGVEIMLNAAAIIFVGSSLHWQNLEGQAFTLILLAVAATEVSVGLAIVVYAFRRKDSLDPSSFNLLQ